MGATDMYATSTGSLRRDPHGAAYSPAFEALPPGAPSGPPLWQASVTGLLFDLDGVLYDNSAWKLWLYRTVGRLGLHASYHAFFATWEQDYLRPACLGKTSLEAALRGFLRSAGLSHGQADEVVTASRSQLMRHQTTERPLPGVAATLKRLSGTKLRMGIVCNATDGGDAVWSRLDRAGIATCFSSVVTSVEMGHALPDLHGYQVAAQRLAAPAGLLAFIGGCASRVAAARRAGMAAISVGVQSGTPANACLNDIRELGGIFA